MWNGYIGHGRVLETTSGEPPDGTLGLEARKGTDTEDEEELHLSVELTTEDRESLKMAGRNNLNPYVQGKGPSGASDRNRKKKK